jgi:hypothetical protein
MEKLECPNCGGTNVSTKIEHEVIQWGQAGDAFECDTPIRRCQDCKQRWIDNEGMEAHTLAQFKFEKSKGINRTKFCNETERRLWETA